MATTGSDKRLSPDDPNSYARPDVAKVTNMDLDLTVDFQKQVLTGSVILTVEKVDPKAENLILDTRHLDIESVVSEADGSKLDFKVGAEGYVGSRCDIQLPASENATVKVKIAYSTTQNCTALQWLNPGQTAGKRHPYLFSQCQAIHARSMIPCQDTPSVKSTYSAKISAPSEIAVVMSAVRQGEAAEDNQPGHKVHRFVQKIPVQSYLIAIAAGDLVSRKIGPRSHVWSEQEYVEKAAHDFEDTEIMLQKAEELCGPYVWGTYDILVLPPSFPFGGMENPCLTFATPTLLAGDKSLSDVIAHEIAHSWTGNLVTNKNFEHFWLNEGFTVFTEQKIVGRMHGEPARHFSALGGMKDLAYTIDVMGADNPLTKLIVDLNGVDPDDAFSTVPYVKGSTFLWYLENLVGGPDIFEPFLRAYYEQFKYLSIDSYQFKKFFLDYFKDVDQVDWDGWFFKPGMPTFKPDFDDSMAKVCQELRTKWTSWNGDEPCPLSGADMNDFISGQKIEFLALLLEEAPLSHAKLDKMQELYDLDSVVNSEIRFRWIRLGLRGKWQPAVAQAVQMVTEQGRMKFLRPLYRDLYAWEDTREVAIQTFLKNKDSMMHVAVQGLELDLKLKQ